MSVVHKGLLPLLIPIQKDVEIFLTKYSEKKPSESSFEFFKTIWNDMHLQLIYSCRPIEELFLFQNLLLHTVKLRLFPPYPSLWNLGAIYLLFAFIELVPYKRHLEVIRLRVTLDDLKKIQILLRYLRVDEEHEAIVILMSILENHCLVTAHPASDLNVEFTRQCSHRINDHKASLDIIQAELSSLTEMTTDAYMTQQLANFGFLEKMIETNKQYCSMKAITPNVSESKISTLIGKDLIANFVHDSPAVVFNAVKATEITKKKDIGKLRIELKNKAFSTDNRSSLRRLSETVAESSPSPKKPPYSPPKISKARSDRIVAKKNYTRSRNSKVPFLETSATMEKIEHNRIMKAKAQSSRYSGKVTSYDLKRENIAKKIKAAKKKELML